MENENEVPTPLELTTFPLPPDAVTVHETVALGSVKTDAETECPFPIKKSVSAVLRTYVDGASELANSTSSGKAGLVFFGGLPKWPRMRKMLLISPCHPGFVIPCPGSVVTDFPSADTVAVPSITSLPVV